MSKNIDFITTEIFKQRTATSTAVDDLQVRPFIKVAQDMYILPSLGSALYARLQAGIDAGNLNVNEKTLLNEYITDSLVWYTMSLLPMGLGYQVFSKGFLQKTSEESITPTRGDLELIENKYKAIGEYYNKRLIVYLKENYTKHYEYLNPGSGVDTIFPQNNAYTCPIYLGNTETRNNPLYVNSSSGSSLVAVYYRPTAGLSTFTVDDIGTRTVKTAARSGLTKQITDSATTDSGFLQINGKVITLPTGDVTQANEDFIFLVQ